jgi:hypothetical protein
VQGDITASTSLSGVELGQPGEGNHDFSPTIDLKASGLLVTGDVKALNSLSIASGNGIKGNVEGGNVTLDSSECLHHRQRPRRPHHRAGRAACSRPSPARPTRHRTRAAA